MIRESVVSTKFDQVFSHNCRLFRFFLNDFVKLLNYFETLNALLMAQKALIDQDIERIANTVLLFFTN